jgi:hypothetical protein
MTRSVFVVLAVLSLGSWSIGAPLYLNGVSTPCGTCIVGTHLVSPDAHPSVPGAGSGLNKVFGSALDGQRTYIYDYAAAPDLADGVANRGDTGFAMMIWDFGAAYNTMRLYTHQDHYFGGLVTTDFVGQDLMEYSVWGSNDGDSFVLLSDVVSYNLNGGGVGIPTYGFAGTEPTTIYRGGSTEFGVLNAYTRDYTFSQSYRYYGIRSSSVTLNYPGGPDADPEIDTIFAHQGRITPPGEVPEPATVLLLAAPLAWMLIKRTRK